VLLSILQVGGDAYPPLILEQLGCSMKRNVARRSLYGTLDWLEHKGLLHSKPGPHEQERGGHPKRYLSVTDKAIAALRECPASLMSLWAGLDSIIQE
jgi:DNA-binding PadR family transcriptional regulator